MHTLLCIHEPHIDSSALLFDEEVITALQSKVTLLTIQPPGETPRIGKAILKQTTELLPTPPTNQFVRYGEFDEQILNQVKLEHYDLVIVHAGRQSEIQAADFGAVIQRLSSHSDASILLVRGQRTQLNHILIATAGHQASEPTVNTGAHLAKSRGARLTLLHVTDYYPGMYTGMSRLEETLEELLQSDTPVARHLKSCAALFSSMGIDAQIELRHGIPEDEILDDVGSGSYDLLVIGKSARGLLFRVLRPEVSRSIIDHAICPILIVNKPLGAARSMSTKLFTN